jgi:hypothetical protein
MTPERRIGDHLIWTLDRARRHRRNAAGRSGFQYVDVPDLPTTVVPVADATRIVATTTNEDGQHSVGEPPRATRRSRLAGGAGSCPGRGAKRVPGRSTTPWLSRANVVEVQVDLDGRIRTCARGVRQGVDVGTAHSEVMAQLTAACVAAERSQWDTRPLPAHLLSSPTVYAPRPDLLSLALLGPRLAFSRRGMHRQ